MTEQHPAARAPLKPAAIVAAIAAACAICAPQLTRPSEGRRYAAYYDIARVLTICDGDTTHVRVGERDTDAQCDARLKVALTTHGRAVLAATPALADRPYQLAAAIDLAYNIGDAAYAGSSVARRFAADDWRGGCDAMLAWDRARVGGPKAPPVVVPGLAARRQRERVVCMRGLA